MLLLLPLLLLLMLLWVLRVLLLFLLLLNVLLPVCGHSLPVPARAKPHTWSATNPLARALASLRMHAPIRLCMDLIQCLCLLCSHPKPPPPHPTSVHMPVLALSIWAGDRRGVDEARVDLGMARGNAKLGVYMNVITFDIGSLLQWKNNRIAFDGYLRGK